MVIALVAIIARGSGGVAAPGAIPVNGVFAHADDGVAQCVRTTGVHPDFVPPARSTGVDRRAHFPRLAGTYDPIAFGWGDRALYPEMPTRTDP